MLSIQYRPCTSRGPTRQPTSRSPRPALESTWPSRWKPVLCPTHHRRGRTVTRVIAIVPAKTVQDTQAAVHPVMSVQLGPRRKDIAGQRDEPPRQGIPSLFRIWCFGFRISASPPQRRPPVQIPPVLDERDHVGHLLRRDGLL